MWRSVQKPLASVVSAGAGLIAAVSIGLLVALYVDGQRQAESDKARTEGLTQQARQDAAYVAALAAELKRQTDLSLERADRRRFATNLLIVSAVVFLLSAKWSIKLRPRRVPSLGATACEQHVCVYPCTGGRAASGTEDTARTENRRCASTEVQTPDLRFVDRAVERCGRSRAAAIPILNTLQAHYHYLPDAALKRVCDVTEITPAQIDGVASFYRRFRRTPAGEHVIKVCHGTACHVAGADVVTDELRRRLHITPGSDTDPLGRFTIEEVACLGCCTLAPLIQIDQIVYGHLAPDRVADVINEHVMHPCNGARFRGSGTAARHPDGTGGLQGELRVGLGSCCVAGGSGKVFDALEQAVAASGVNVTVKRVGCVGMCHRTPMVEAVVPGQPSKLYTGVGPADARDIVRKHFRSRRPIKRWSDKASALVSELSRNGDRPPVTLRSADYRDPPVAAFLGRQKHIATEHAGTLDPVDLDEYLRHDGFNALRWSLTELSPDGVINEIRRSGLRGRGGAGYPTGLKWHKVRQAVDRPKYVICNGDEGDPGAFMDRMIMESFPYRVIEGMAIAAYAVGAGEGYFYIRAEYPLAVERIRHALGECERRGLVGDNVLGTGMSLRLQIMEGAGAFVCGEETALIASLEGRRGSPRLRPPFPSDAGLWGKPTLVGNVETYATVPWIMRHGAAEFARLGTATSKGTKVFALAGKVKRGGLIEVPMGITIREIVEEIGGGIKDGRAFKAVQIGGPSGGCVPAARADTPVDYEALTKVGAIMGSGGLVVLDDSDCMVDMARYFLSFTQDQSCGKCTFCRIGTRRMLEILDRLCGGQGRPGDLETLEDLAQSVCRGSLCGLGKTAPNPVLTTLRYFRDEYEAHLEGVCPAGKCTGLIEYRVNDRCSGCTLCAQHCPADAIAYMPYERHRIDSDKCTRCDICRLKCPEDAIEVVSPCRA